MSNSSSTVYTPESNMVLDGHLGGYLRGGDPTTYCAHLWTWIVRRYGIRSVLDVGCGEGYSTAFFRNLGCDVLGVDGCQQAIDSSVVPGLVVRHDFCDGPFLARRNFDLIWSCEFLEHVEARYVDNLLATFRQARKLVLVTHARPGQSGHHHVNCQPASYWIDTFRQADLHCDLPLTFSGRWAAMHDHRSRNHFARSGLAFVKGTKTTAGSPGRERASSANSAHGRRSLGGQTRSIAIRLGTSLLRRGHRLLQAA